MYLFIYLKIYIVYISFLNTIDSIDIITWTTNLFYPEGWRFTRQHNKKNIFRYLNLD